MDLNISHLIVGLVSAVIGALVASILTRSHVVKNLQGKTPSDDERKHEFLKGTLAGHADELSKFEIRYQPVLVDDDGFWNHSFDAGYEMQLFYASLPIGDPTRRITHRQEKAKDENIHKVLDAVMDTLQTLAAVASKSHIPTRIARQPRNTIKGQ